MTHTATRTPQRIEFLTDIYTTGLEGGINYWATVTSYQHTTQQLATITDNHDDEHPHTIDLNTIARGIRAITTHRVHTNPAHRQRIAAADRAHDAADLDAADADAIIQAALFGEIRYG